MSTNIRKDRGYRWEDVVTRRFNQCYSWRAFRLGFGSIALPDVLAMSNKFTTIEAIECIAPDTPIITRDGIKYACEVRVGDKVLTHRGRFQPISHVFVRRYTGKVIRIRPLYQNEEISITPDHPLLVKRHGHGKFWLPACEVQLGDQLLQPYLSRSRLRRSPVHKCKDGFWFPVKTVREGFYDGSVYNFAVNQDESYTAHGFAVHNCKSGTTDYVVVKREQIERSLRFLDAFRLYPKRLCVLAIKFSRKRRLKGGDYEPRELREYFILFDKELNKGERAPDIIISYSGSIQAVSKGGKTPIDLPLLKMPFEN